MKYVILLRGVNVWGKRKVPKDVFKQVLENLGFSDVFVYINSGNAVFGSDTPPNSSDMQETLEKYFGFDIESLILSEDKIRMIADAIPNDWTNDAPNPEKSWYQSNVLYLFDAINTPDVLEKLGYNPEIETMKYVDGAVLTTISRKNQWKGSLQKIAGTKLYHQITIRNVNTARKLAELVQ